MYTRKYSNFRGVDFSSARSECDPSRFNYLINMWRDYKSEQGAAVETAIGFEKIGKLGGRINGIHLLPAANGEPDKFIIHSGKNLYALDPSKPWIEKPKGDEVKNPVVVEVPTNVLNEVRDARSQTVTHFGALYYVDGGMYLKIENGNPVKAVGVAENGYIPTTFTYGIPYEQRNIGRDRVVETYSPKNGEREFAIHDPSVAVKIKVDGEPVYPFRRRGTNEVSGHTYEYIGDDGVEFTPEEKTSTTTVQFDLASTNIRLGKIRESYYDDAPDVSTDINTEEAVFYLVEQPASSGKERYTLLSNSEYITFTYDTYTRDDGTNGFIITSVTFAKNVLQQEVILDGKEIRLESRVSPSRFVSVGEMRDILTGNPDMQGRAIDAINGCTLITEFDGRVFLSGNPALPNSVFYTQRDLDGINDPFYVGAYNYLNDGTDSTPITAMLTTPTNLIVLKGDSPQGSSVYYHTAEYNPSEDKVTADLQPRIYPRESGVPNVGCLGYACNFLDDPIYISRNGAEALGKAQVNLERTISHRSSNVDAMLRNEDLSGVVGAEWEGYLCLLAPSGRMYLADSRQIFTHFTGVPQYEWYMWDTIGVWEGDRKQYYYVSKYLGAPVTVDGKVIGWKDDSPYTGEGEVKRTNTATYEGDAPTNFTPTYSYVEEDGVAFLVDWYGEMAGGEFKAGTALFVYGDRLYFGCENGAVCVFHNERDASSDADHYLPRCYTHDGHRYLSGCAFLSDNCGSPHYAKSTIRGSFVIVSKSFPYAKVAVRVRTNNTAWYEADTITMGRPDFRHFDFSSFSFNLDQECVSVVKEREKRWMEKQIYLVTECWESPFGIMSATYDYKIQGRVKEQ